MEKKTRQHIDVELVEMTKDPWLCGSSGGSQDISSVIGHAHMDSSSSHGDIDLYSLHTAKGKTQVSK